jgi:hypothetical protein
VVLEDGSLYFFGCSYGDVTLAFDTDRKGQSWNRVRFTDSDAVYSGVGPTSVWPGFGNAVIESLEVVFDEGTEVGPGFVYLDNLDEEAGGVPPQERLPGLLRPARWVQCPARQGRPPLHLVPPENADEKLATPPGPPGMTERYRSTSVWASRRHSKAAMETRPPRRQDDHPKHKPPPLPRA